MRPTSPLSLLLFLHLTSSAPIPLSHNILITSCSYTSCQELLTNPATPPTTLRNPHFPTHQINSNSDEIIDNRPTNPSVTVSPSHALTATKPLVSSYLIAISNPTLQHPPQGPLSALPAKPSSALPSLRKADAKRYWASLRAGRTSTKDENGEEMVMSDGPVEPSHQTMVKCGGNAMDMNTFPGGYYYIRHRTTTVVREYSDVVVVGIVLLFLAIVVCVEAVEKFGNLRNPFSRNSNGQRTTQRHGAIFLADDEEVAFIIPKPFCLQPAPSRSKTVKQNKGCESETESEKFTYDSDAERV
ncbi:hypothetical protein B0J14DRAFT_86566 [Halenospora varia]|nr:hypothetical protein B0J14DRAFT_86566 [Halenospora varia]